MKMTFQEIRIIATGPCIANQLRDVNTICRRSWYIAAHICKIYDFKIEVVPFIINCSTDGTKTNMRSTTMANNRHAYKRDVLQRYWTSDGLPLYCRQRTVEKTQTKQQCENLLRSGRPRVTSDRDDRELQRLVRRMPFATNTGGPIDLCQQEQLETV